MATPEQIQAAIEGLERKLSTLSSDPNASIDDIERINNKIELLSAKISTASTEQPTQPAPQSPEAKSQSSSGYWYEPSVDQVKQRLSSDPELSQRLNLTSWTSSPDQLDSVDENSTAYKAVADDLYSSTGNGATRYKDVSVAKNPFSWAMGGIQKYAPGIVSNFAKGATVGLRDPIIASAGLTNPNMSDTVEDPTLSPEYQALAKQRGQENVNKVRELDERSGVPGKVAEFAGAMNPFSPGSLMAHGVTDALNYTGRGVLGKSVSSAAAGTVAANTEGAISDAIEGQEQGKSWGDIAKTALERAPLRTGVGALGGAGFDLVGQAAGKVAKGRVIRDPDVKLLREAGGDTHIVKGVTAPENIQENINKYVEGKTGDVGHAEDIAAAKVAPQIQSSLESQARQQHEAIGKTLQSYLAEPNVKRRTVSVRPAIENMVELATSGTYKGPLTGKVNPTNPNQLKAVQRLINELGESKVVNADQVGNYAAMDGVVIDREQAAALGKSIGANQVMVIVPSKRNAEAVLKMEDRIYDELGFSKNSKGREDPLWRRLNEGFKKVRDQFPYPDVEDTIPSSIGAGDTVPLAADATIPAPAPEFTPPPQGTKREPTASQYAEGNFGEGPKERFSDLDPEVNQSLNEVNYSNNIQAQQREAERVARLMSELGVKPTAPVNKPAAKTELSTDSVFPEVKDQIGNADPTKFAKEAQTVDVGKVKQIVDQTDSIAESLSPDEIDSIHSYTSRKGDKVGTEAWKSATKKLTVKEPTQGGTLYHGTRMPSEELAKILKDKKLSLSKPTSTSYNNGIASAMAYSRANRGEPVIFEIHQVDDGISLASKKLGIRGTNNEKEVLLQDKDFEVAGTRKNDDGDLVIELRQTKKPVPQKTATLDDGTTVTGLSALQREHHLSQKALEEATNVTGANSLQNVTRKTIGFGAQPGQAQQDAALLEQARKLGLEKELRETAGTAAYQRLVPRAWGASGRGPWNSTVDFVGMRADPVTRAMSGQPRNPAAPNPNTPAGRIAQYLFTDQARNALNSTRGLPVARLAPAAEEFINEQDKDRQK